MLKIKKDEVIKGAYIAMIFLFIVFTVEFSLSRFVLSEIVEHSELIMEQCSLLRDKSEVAVCFSKYINERNNSALWNINSYIVTLAIIAIYTVVSKVRKLIKDIKSKRG